jgi:hypothetical protein
MLALGLNQSLGVGASGYLGGGEPPPSERLH